MRKVLLILLILVVALVLTLRVYAGRIRSSADALIESARNIHSTEDAKLQIAKWRSRSDRDFSESEATGGDHAYEINIANGRLGELGIAFPTMLGVSIAMHDGELRYVTVVMFSGKHATSTAGVWIQEWFLGTTRKFRVSRQGEPFKAVIEFSSDISVRERDRMFHLNTECMVRFRGCMSAQDILPGVWQLQLQN